MHEHLTRTAEQVIKQSNTIAREFGRDYVGTEHVLLAFGRVGEGAASAFLADRGLDENVLRQTLLELISDAMEQSWVFGRLPGSPHFKAVVEHAIAEAQAQNAGHVGTNHLLLGLLHDAGTMAHRMLQHHGVDAEAAREGLAGKSDPA